MSYLHARTRCALLWCPTLQLWFTSRAGHGGGQAGGHPHQVHQLQTDCAPVWSWCFNCHWWWSEQGKLLVCLPERVIKFVCPASKFLQMKWLPLSWKMIMDQILIVLPTSIWRKYMFFSIYILCSEKLLNHQLIVLWKFSKVAIAIKILAICM